MTIDEFTDEAVKNILAFKDEVKEKPDSYPTDTDEDEWLDQLLAFLGIELE